MDLHHSEYITTEGRLRFFQADKIVPVIATPLAVHQMCQIMFGRDGSIYVDFPFFENVPGIVSRIELDEPTPGPVTIDLREEGRASSHQVKFSHHTSGEALFSKTGKVRTEVRKPWFTLQDTIGYLFHLHAYWLSGFDLLPTRNRKKKLYLPAQFDSEIPGGVTIVAHWRRKQDILDNVESVGKEDTVGPAPNAIERQTGRKTRVFLIGQPSKSPLQDHLILLECYPAEPPNGVENSMMIFLGGWDPHEIDPPGLDVRMPVTGFLTFMYPTTNPEELKGTIGSIDLKMK